MHYHVLLIDDQGEHLDSASTYDTQREAEEQAATLVREIEGPEWSAKRYPGRVWRPQEIAVYLDRRPLERGIPMLELASGLLDMRRADLARPFAERAARLYPEQDLPRVILARCRAVSAAR